MTAASEPERTLVNTMAGPGAEPRGRPRLDPTTIRSRPKMRATLTEDAEQVLERLVRARRRSSNLSALTYNITISHRHRLVWFRNAKVGTRSILDYLSQHHPDGDLLVASGIPYPTAAFADYFKFAMVRHPLDRFISAWQDKVFRVNLFRFDEPTLERMQTIENFAAWVAEKDLRARRTNRHLKLQSRMIDLSHVDYLGRMESFDDDFAAVCREVGLPVQTPERRNQSTPRGVTRENASKELRSIVEEMYRRDYQIFGY
ncbi:MAG: sulfotransferase family 2 domain-containing protein [Nocardioides sp.]